MTATTITVTLSAKSGDIIHIPTAIQGLLRDIVQRLNPRRILLFGSRAVGDSEPRSDFDVAVDAPGADPDQWTRLVLDNGESLDSLLRIDLVRYDTAPAELRRNIDRDGILLYERPQ